MILSLLPSVNGRLFRTSSTCGSRLLTNVLQRTSQTSVGLQKNVTHLELDPTVLSGVWGVDAADPRSHQLSWSALTVLALTTEIGAAVHPRVKSYPPRIQGLLDASSSTLTTFHLCGHYDGLALPAFFGQTIFPLLTTLDHPHALELPHQLPHSLFSALAYLTATFHEDEPTPAIRLLLTPSLREVTLFLPSLDKWLPFIEPICRSCSMLRRLQVETLNARTLAGLDAEPFNLATLRSLAAVCVEHGIKLVSSDSRIWSTESELAASESAYRDDDEASSQCSGVASSGVEERVYLQDHAPRLWDDGEEEEVQAFFCYLDAVSSGRDHGYVTSRPRFTYAVLTLRLKRSRR